nr:hypothetical protein [Bradyrhizobium diazoefficiens]
MRVLYAIAGRLVVWGGAAVLTVYGLGALYGFVALYGNLKGWW